MGTRRLDEAVEGAAVFRLLRTLDLKEARRIRAELATVDAGDELVRTILGQRMRQLVAHARKWNRQLIIAERDVRRVLFARPQRRLFAVDGRAPRGSMGQVLYGLGVSVGPPTTGGAK